MARNEIETSLMAPTAVDPIELQKPPSFQYEGFYRRHGDSILKVGGAVLYLVAAALLLFHAAAPLWVAFGLTILAGIVSFCAALADYHRHMVKHEAQVAKIETALRELPDDREIEGAVDKFNKNRVLAYRQIHYPAASLVLSAASSAFLILIVILNLVGVLSGAAVLATPAVLVGLIIANMAFIIVKDLVINKLVEIKSSNIREVSGVIAERLDSLRIQHLKHHLPLTLRNQAHSPLPQLKAAVQAWLLASPPLANPQPMVSEPAGNVATHSDEGKRGEGELAHSRH